MLPRYSAPLVGRRSELDTLAADVFGREGVWTLAGPPGVGKTRLAAALGHRWMERGQRVAFCDLSEATEPWGLVGTVAPAIGLTLGETQSAEQAVGRVGRALGHRRGLLLVLDNCEQVRSVGDVVDAWVAAGQQLRVVVTSRRPLRLAPEHVHRVGPLPEADAIDLFLDRAGLQTADLAPSGPSRQTVRAIVEKLDRLPLAIELVAARSTALSPTQMKDRLVDRFPLARRRASGRHAALETAIEWSWELLGEHERTVLQQCSVLSGGFDLGDVEGVVPGDIRALEAVESLVDHSLLQIEPSDSDRKHFGMLESVAEFARAKLEQSGELESARERHAAHFRAVSDTLWTEFAAGHTRSALRRFREKKSNLLGALDWELQRQPERAAQLAIAIDPLWTVHGPFFAQLHVLGNVYRYLPNPPRDLRARARLELAYGSALRRAGALVQGREVLERSLARLGPGDLELRAEVYTALAWLETIEGDEQRGQELGRCALQDARNAGSERAEGLAAAVVGGSGGQLDMLRLAADLARRRGDELQEASAQWLHARGLVEWGRPIEALSTAERALQLSRDLGDRRLEALVMGALAQAHHFARDPERALQWYAEAIALHAADGHQLMQGVRLGEMARIECELGRLVDARTHASESVRLTRDAGYPAGAAASQALLSIVSAVAGQHQEARALLDEAHAEAGEHPPVTTEVLLHAAAAWLEGDRARVAPVLDEPNGDGAVRVPIHVRAVRRLWEGVARTATEAGETAAVADPRALVVGHGAAWFALGEAEPVSLHRRQALRSILSALVEARQRSPGRAVDDETLIGQAWPAQRIARGSARNRLRNAISTLRRAGLKEVLLTRSDGYLLDPDRALRRRSEDPFNGD